LYCSVVLLNVYKHAPKLTLIVFMCNHPETTAMDDFKKKHDDLLIATLVMICVVLVVDLVALIMHNITICRTNPQGKTLKPKWTHCKISA